MNISIVTEFLCVGITERFHLDEIKLYNGSRNKSRFCVLKYLLLIHGHTFMYLYFIILFKMLTISFMIRQALYKCTTIYSIQNDLLNGIDSYLDIIFTKSMA